jgi:hypothetical protein
VGLPRLSVAAAALIGAALSACGTDVAPDQPAVARPAGATPAAPPFAAGDGAANIALDDRRKRVVLRWVARRTGRIEALHVRVKVSGRGYAAGSTGVLLATTYPVRRDGRPRTSAVLAKTRLTPGRRQWGGSLALPLQIWVRAGQEFATVVRNAAANARRDYFSANFLYAGRGLVGANARNERSASASDAHYGLDPRELVGYSGDGGKTWHLPGGPYGVRGGRSFIPTYVQQYADGTFEGQGYYWAAPVSGRVTMVFPDVVRDWTITRIGAFANGGSAEVVVAVNGARRAGHRLEGSGFLAVRVPEIRVEKGSTVTVTTTAGSGGLELEQQHADEVWARFLRLGPHHRWYLRGAPTTAVPVYPLPAPPRPA